jgi:hypothetical protein
LKLAGSAPAAAAEFAADRSKFHLPSGKRKRKSRLLALSPSIKMAERE